MAETLTLEQMQQRLSAAPEPKKQTLSVDEMNSRLATQASDESDTLSLSNVAQTVDDLMRSLASGITFNQADEFAALMSSLTGIGEQPGGTGSYETNLEAERLRDEEIPLAVAIPGEIAGGVMTGVGGARALASQLPRLAGALPSAFTRAATTIAKPVTAAPRFVQAPLAGGATGAAYGFGAGEGGLENRLNAAAMGGALGFGAGAVAYPVMRGLEGAVTGLRNVAQNRLNPEGAVRRGFATALRRDNLTPGRAQRRMNQLGEEAVLADVSPNLRGFARGATTVPGPAKTRADLVLQNRAAGESARIGDRIATTLRPKNYFAAQDDLFKDLRDNARDLYRKAYAEGPELRSERLTELLKRPIVRDAIKEAEDLARISGEELAPSPPGGISTAALDDIKRGFDRMLERGRNRNKTTGRLNKRGTAILELRNQILKEADDLNPAYGAARAQYASDFDAVQALRQGRQFQSMAPEEISKFMVEADEGAKEAFRSGAARSMLETLERAGDTATASNRLFGNKAVRDRMRQIFPSDEAYREISNVLRAEMRFGRTRNNLLSGSDTAVKLAEQGDVGLVNEAVAREGGFLGNLARGAYQRAVAPNDEVATGIARLMLNRNPEANRAALDAILPLMQSQASSEARRRMIEDAVIRGLTQTIGTQTGRRYSEPYTPPPEMRMANGN